MASCAEQPPSIGFVAPFVLMLLLFGAISVLLIRYPSRYLGLLPIWLPKETYVVRWMGVTWLAFVVFLAGAFGFGMVQSLFCRT
jgi:hypothetical protein